jgi:hypothetical protein
MTWNFPDLPFMQCRADSRNARALPGFAVFAEMSSSRMAIGPRATGAAIHPSAVTSTADGAPRTR